MKRKKEFLDAQRKVKVKDLSPEINFDDSSLMDIRMSSDLSEIVVVVFAPYAGEDYDYGRYYQIVFNGVLEFKFLTSSAGNPSESPLLIRDLYLIEDDDLHNWKEVIVSQESPSGSKKGNFPPVKNENGYKDVFHIVFGEKTHIEDGKYLGGKEVFCRHIAIEDITNQWHKKHSAMPDV